MQRQVFLERMLQVFVAVLVVLGVVLLGMGQRTMSLSVLVAVAAVASIYITDIYGWLRLNRTFANLLAVAAVVWALFQSRDLDTPDQLLSVANLQAFLQVILFFQQKNARIYWQLILLSLGQVVVASALNLGPTFGLVLLVYLFVGVLALSLLLLFRETISVERRAPAVSRPRPGPSERQTDHRGDRLRWPLADSPVIELRGSHAAVAPRSLGFGLFRQSTFLCLGSLLISIPLFFLLPRFGGGGWQTAVEGSLRVVGFSKSVSLGDLGEVVENRDVVMRVQLFNRLTDTPYRVLGELLFRGAVVTEYERGKWRQGPRGNLRPVTPSPTPPEFVRQEITVEPLDESVLFCVHPIFEPWPSDARLQIDDTCNELVRQRAFRSERFRFEVSTTGIRNGRQVRLNPAERVLYPEEQQHLLQLPGTPGSADDPFKALRAEAADVVRRRQLPQTGRLAIARALEEHLSTTGGFKYSLQPQQRDPALDPLEDFMTLHRQGHCEYFAGALALMLRSQGIPARVAIGFKGGEWNSLGGYYQVRQLHAHAWVEAYLEPEHCRGEPLSSEIEEAGGAWLVLDPTAITNAEDAAAQYSAGLLTGMYDYAKVLWSSYVIGLSAERQQESIYRPIARGATAAFKSVVDPQTWRARAERISESRVGKFWKWFRGNWFSPIGGLVAAGLLLAFYALARLFYFMVRGLWRLVRSSRNKRSPRAVPSAVMVARLESALAQYGLQRSAAQTPHEFALAAGAELAETISHQRLASFPRRIIEAFYRVRFGGRTLDNAEAEAVEHALTELERPKAAPTRRP